MRYVCFDVETTGLEIKEGDRIFQIGAVELIDRKISRQFTEYCNPEKALSEVSMKICSISNNELNDKKLFAEIASQFIDFISYDANGSDDKAILVAHNAQFDIKFINNEFKLANIDYTLNDHIVIDTMHIARHRAQGQAYSLDQICKRLNIDTKERHDSGHSAIMDSMLLAQMFTKMCKDDSDEAIQAISEPEQLFFGFHKNEYREPRLLLQPTKEELKEHNAFLKKFAIE